MPAENWHLDKRVPLAQIAALLIQTLLLGMWIGNHAHRLSVLEETVRAASDQPGRVIRLETKIESIERGIGDLNRKMDRIIEGAKP